MSLPKMEQQNKPSVADPDAYRMTIGEHLEELRWRLILGLGGFVLVFIVCLIFVKETVMPAFCAPLLNVLEEYMVTPQLFVTEVSSAFMVYIKVSLISAGAIASPWMLFQFWRFVAAGLYEHERHVITRFVPLSITLLIVGLLFVYFLVLPWTLQFFLAFSLDIPMPNTHAPSARIATTQPMQIPVLSGDPTPLTDGSIWFNSVEGRIKLHVGNKTRVLNFGSDNLIAPMITLPTYIDLVFSMLLVFGLSFQLPLVVMALVAVGIVDLEMLKASRRYVYFALTILAAAITPGDVITATIALLLPLMGLYELGIWLARPVKPVIPTEE